MRREWRWALAAAVALAIGATCAEGYARLAEPYYRAVVGCIDLFHPWRIANLAVANDAASHGAVLRIVGEVRQHRGDAQPAALVESRVAVGEIIEAPIVFWTLLLMWPAATTRVRLSYLAAGLPLFLLLEAVTTPFQLVYSMARTSAILAGAHPPLTAWERWSRLLEAGGRFALEVGIAILSVALVDAYRRKRLRDRDTVGSYRTAGIGVVAPGGHAAPEVAPAVAPTPAP